MSDEQEIENAIQEKGLTAPRVTPQTIDAEIVDEAYYVFPGTAVTVCCLTLKNDFKVVGYSSAVSRENFDENIGRRVAYTQARDRIWELVGFRLKDQLHNAEVMPSRPGGPA